MASWDITDNKVFNESLIITLCLSPSRGTKMVLLNLSKVHKRQKKKTEQIICLN